MPCADRLEGYDEIVVDDLMEEIAADGYRMQTLIRCGRDQLSLHASSNPGKEDVQ